MLQLLAITKEFPWEYRYTLGQDLKRDGVVQFLSIQRRTRQRTRLSIANAAGYGSHGAGRG